MSGEEEEKVYRIPSAAPTDTVARGKIAAAKEAERLVGGGTAGRMASGNKGNMGFFFIFHHEKEDPALRDVNGGNLT